MSTSASARPTTNAVLTASLASAALVLAATLFRTNERDLTFTLPPWDTFSQALSIAIMQSGFYLLVLLGLGLLGLFRTWWQRLASGLIAVLVGGTLAYIVQILVNQLPLNAAAWGTIFGEFLGLSFPFAIAGVILPVVVIGPVLRSFTARSEPVAASTGERSAFFRVPPAAMLEGLDQEQQDAANAQWEAVVEAFEQHGWGTEAVPAAEEARESALVGDLALVLGEQIVLARPRGDERRAEIADVRETLERAGGVVDELEAPAVFDPADVVDTGDVLLIGSGGATNESALRQLRRLASSRGRRVVAVPVAEGVRLSEVVSVLPDGTRLVWAPALPQPDALADRISVPEPRGGAVLALDETTIAVSSAAPLTAELIRDLGFETVELDLDAFESIGGTLPRLSLRSRD